MSMIATNPTHAASSGLLFLNLISGRLKPSKLWRSKRFRLKFLLRSLAFPLTTFHYFKYLADLPVMRQAITNQGVLPAKIHRPYLCANFNVEARARAITDHYLFVQHVEDLALRQVLQSTTETVLASVDGKNGEHFVISCCSGYFDREGEVTLVLHYNEMTIGTLSFSIIQEQGITTLFIGGLQGPRKDIPAEVIREATKACFGLFPKRLLMETLFILVDQSGIKRIRAVGDSQHVFRSLRYRHSKNDVFFASYSEFWLTLGGEADEQDVFTLPLSVERKALEDIASKKRAEYRRRYALMDRLQAEVPAAIGGYPARG
ncbi:hypothetical protein PMPD1_0112 [Paramixta manurensis]|uniref:DUF535 domain-containing protein n=1 Tax=Paramixta manurensis TaxID=2740817 RepID=A0A6M8U2Z8_9GAMM|nr:hypothetical protein PMPD1_0112 [Erwiniaceae bacterium PD-1]